MSDESPPIANPQDSESSTSGRPRRDGNESLWKRARRTLGTNQLTFLQPQNRPSGVAASTPSSGPAAPNKRREQVRHAQRTHRQRTQNYIKTLESEVVRLREAETKAVDERDKLQSQIRSLKAFIASANLILPPDLADQDDLSTTSSFPNFDFNMPAQVSYGTDDLQHARLHVQWPQQRAMSQPHQVPLPHQQQQQREFSPPNQAYDFRAMTEGLPHDMSFDPLPISPDSASSYQIPSPDQKTTSATYATEIKPSAQAVATLETAIDFVLALEAPCMSHIPYPADQTGTEHDHHIMMMSAPLVAFAPQAPTPNMNWPASAAIIKELLNLSSSINLEGELTPVAAWHQLHQHPDFWRLDKPAIDTMKRELSAAVNCYGFGAVLDEDAFRVTLDRLIDEAKRKGG